MAVGWTGTGNPRRLTAVATASNYRGICLNYPHDNPTDAQDFSFVVSNPINTDWSLVSADLYYNGKDGTWVESKPLNSGEVHSLRSRRTISVATSAFG